MNAGIDEALVHWLSNLAPLTALIGTRLYPDKAPEGATFPHVTYTLVTGERLRNLKGPAGYSMPKFQIDCWALSKISARRTARAIIGEQDANDESTGLDGYTGYMGPNTGKLYVQSAEVEQVQDFYDPPQNASDSGVFRVSFDVVLYFNENGS